MRISGIGSVTLPREIERAPGHRGHIRDSWIALPQAHEETDPSFQQFAAASLPTFEDAGVRARMIAGSAFDRTSPVGLLSEWLYAEVSLAAGARAPFDPGQEERAIYVVEGEGEWHILAARS